jgi:L-2-hydroxyglutarate oxidase LhgO
VIVVEAERAIGTGASSRNSEVIHAGIYYPTGLTKTRLCVEGNAMLYAFCRDYGVPHLRCGKLIVAANEAETTGLAALEAQARASGVDDLVWLTGEEARALEPALKANRGLLSPSTGIVDSHALMLALRATRRRMGQWSRSRRRLSRDGLGVAAWRWRLRAPKASHLSCPAGCRMMRNASPEQICR